MVAINQDFAAIESELVAEKTRLGIFFAERTLPQTNRLGVAITAREKTDVVTIIVPGIPYWLSRDPLGEETGYDAEIFGDSPNLYGYVLNNPINFWDPYGLEHEKNKRKSNYDKHTKNRPGARERGDEKRKRILTTRQKIK